MFRRPLPAALVTLILLVLLDGYWEPSLPVETFAVVTAVLETVVVWAGLLYLLIRFGLFALAMASFVVFRLQMWPFTVDPSDLISWGRKLHLAQNQKNSLPELLQKLTQRQVGALTLRTRVPRSHLLRCLQQG